MTELLQCMVYFLLMWPLKPIGAFPHPGRDLGRNRTQRDVHCRENMEYPNDNICCLNCPAGTRLISPCNGAGRRGQCEECEYGTYTEHDNGLRQCFKCTQCRLDQEIVRPCTHTQDRECQCKLGKFCDPDDACEVCKKCSRCGKDEVVVRNCTPTANTECKKIQPISVSASVEIWQIVVPVLGVLLVIGIFAYIFIRRRQATGSQRNPDGLKAGQHHSDTCPTEESSNGETRRPSRISLIQSRQLEDEQFPTLVPVNGEESLKNCLAYFEEIDYDLHKRFFRHLGISDNEIKSRQGLQYDDKIHDLLKVWMEKRGREASLNDLLKALLDLNHRLTAEIIKDKALDNGHYVCECK